VGLCLGRLTFPSRPNTAERPFLASHGRIRAFRGVRMWGSGSGTGQVGVRLRHRLHGMSEEVSPIPGSSLLGAGQIRELAGRLGVRPTKHWGQNFVIDANTVRRIVRLADVRPDDVVVEIGPGLGSLTLALLPQVARVVAVEIDTTLAAALPGTVAALAPAYIDRLDVVAQDAMTVHPTTSPCPWC
jgi:hypothetical protein